MQFKDLKVGDYFKALSIIDHVMVVAYGDDCHKNTNGFLGRGWDTQRNLIGSVLKDGTMIYGLKHEEVMLMDVTIEAKPNVLTIKDLNVGEKFRFIISNGDRSIIFMNLNILTADSLPRYTAIEGGSRGFICTSSTYRGSYKIERVGE